MGKYSEHDYVDFIQNISANEVKPNEVPKSPLGYVTACEYFLKLPPAASIKKDEC